MVFCPANNAPKSDANADVSVRDRDQRRHRPAKQSIAKKLAKGNAKRSPELTTGGAYRGVIVPRRFMCNSCTPNFTLRRKFPLSRPISGCRGPRRTALVETRPSHRPFPSLDYARLAITRPDLHLHFGIHRLAVKSPQCTKPSIPQPVVVATAAPEERAPLQLNLIPRLARKQSQREMAAAIKAPPLTPVRVEPLRWSTASSSLSFLSNIDRLEINETVERNGVTYYVLEVFQFHYNSRLPTNVNNPRMAVTRLSDASETREPDFRVERRYSDFAKLRQQIKLWTCPNSQFTCQYCYEYGRYMRFKLRQPRLLVSLTAKNVEKRKEILQEFMTDFVDLAQNPSKNTVHRCEALQHVPALLESFLRD